jgi:hypothetical protein
MKKLFVSEEVADLAKESGFDELCLGYYKQNQLIDPLFREGIRSSDLHNLTAAPIHQQLQDWFEEKHGIYCYIVPQDKGWVPYAYKKGNYITHKHIDLDASRYKALNEAFKEAFKLLKIDHEKKRQKM